MQVVEHQYERLRHREQLEQLAYGAMRSEAFVPESRPHAGCMVIEGGEDVAELRAIGLVQRGQAAGIQSLEVVVERIDEDPERQLTLELRRAPRQHGLPLRVRTRAELPEQTGLADTRFPSQLDGAAPPFLELVQGVLEHPNLGGASDESLDRDGMVESGGSITPAPPLLPLLCGQYGVESLSEIRVPIRGSPRCPEG